MVVRRYRWITLAYFLLIVVIYLVPFLNFLGPFKALLAGLLIAQYFGMKESSPAEALGLTAPKSWLKTIVIAIGLAILIFVIRAYFIEDWIHTLFPYPKNIEAVTPDTNEPANIIGWIFLMLFFAAIPEELVWRGFLIPQLAFVFGSKKWAWLISILLVSVFFGFAHSYQGPAGIASTAVGGLAYGLVYYFDGRSLWKVIIVHWLVNSLSLIVETQGW
ncbi:CPBP family intramembrane glutamic endopeptidase [Ekhidna sp. To15]|uniref:CPBP family intramembrane glutamic endopeptidase n=1 Tax=Ekhidna sp. To15 TaxID=3395267 RepID=UPI003F524074